jgi:hypothetical protein
VPFSLPFPNFQATDALTRFAWDFWRYSQLLRGTVYKWKCAQPMEGLLMRNPLAMLRIAQIKPHEWYQYPRHFGWSISWEDE